jgi:hypothetical protein
VTVTVWCCGVGRPGRWVGYVAAGPGGLVQSLSVPPVLDIRSLPVVLKESPHRPKVYIEHHDRRGTLSLLPDSEELSPFLSSKYCSRRMRPGSGAPFLAVDTMPHN